MIISTYAENPIIIIQNTPNFRVEGSFLKIVNDFYKKPTAKPYLKVKE